MLQVGVEKEKSVHFSHWRNQICPRGGFLAFMGRFNHGQEVEEQDLLEACSCLPAGLFQHLLHPTAFPQLIPGKFHPRGSGATLLWPLERDPRGTCGNGPICW